MLPSAMLKNLQLQQSAMTSPFLMENLLQSKATPGGHGDLTSLTLNWAASLVARQRECEIRQQSRVLHPSSSSSPGSNHQDHQEHGGAGPGPGPGRSKEKEYVDVETDQVDGSMCPIERLDSRNSGLEEPDLELDTRYELARGLVVQRETELQEQPDRLAERTTCSCGDEQCTLGPGCRAVQEKEKPQLKFSVSAILGGNHDRRPNPESFQGLPAEAIPAFLQNLQNTAGYSIAKPIARPAAYHPYHRPSHQPPQRHLPPNAHHTLQQLFYRGPYLTVAGSGTGTHHPGAPGTGATFPAAIQGGLGEFAGTGLVFPWATNARGKPRRGMMRRAVFSDLQRRGLEKRFQIQKYIGKTDRKKLAEKLGLKDSQVKIWFQNRRMKWRNSKERELLATGGSREQTLPTKNNPNPDLSDADGDRPKIDLTDVSPLTSPQMPEEQTENEEDEEINVT